MGKRKIVPIPLLPPKKPLYMRVYRQFHNQSSLETRATEFSKWMVDTKESMKASIACKVEFYCESLIRDHFGSHFTVVIQSRTGGTTFLVKKTTEKILDFQKRVLETYLQIDKD